MIVSRNEVIVELQQISC